MDNYDRRKYFSPERKPTQETRRKQSFMLKGNFLAVWDHENNPKRDPANAFQSVKEKHEDVQTQSGLRLMWDGDESRNKILSAVMCYAEKKYGQELIESLMALINANIGKQFPFDKAVESGYIESELKAMFNPQANPDIEKAYQVARKDASLDVLSLLEGDQQPLLLHRRDVMEKMFGEGAYSSDGSVSYELETNIHDLGILYTYPKCEDQPQLSYIVRSL